jgi:hypothetical protein
VIRDRFASVGDLDSRLKIVGRLPDYFTPDVSEQVRSDRDQCLSWVIVDDDSIAGFAVVEKRSSKSAGYKPYDATIRFWERRGFIKIDVIDPLPGWEAGNPCAIHVRLLPFLLSLVHTCDVAGRDHPRIYGKAEADPCDGGGCHQVCYRCRNQQDQYNGATRQCVSAGAWRLIA